MATDLTYLLWKPHYESDEFVAALHGIYSRSYTSGDETIFGDYDAQILAVKFRRDGSVERVAPGPCFVKSDIPRIQALLADSLDRSTAAVRRFLVTTFRPIAGALGYENWFTLMPAPDIAPRVVGDMLGGHPAVLEVQLAGSSNESVTFRRGRRGLLELEALFALLTKEVVQAPPAMTRSHWVIDPADPRRSVYAQGHYHFPGFEASALALSDIASFADIEEVEVDRYFDFGFHGSMVFAVPTSLPSLLARYRALDPARRAKYLRAGYWAKLQHEMRHISKAATFAAIVRAIEALMPSAPTADPCDACGERPGRGTRKAFSRFVDELTGGHIPEKDRLRLYDRRSRLVHGDLLFLWDEGLMMSGPRELAERNELHTVERIAQIVFHNWLCEQAID